MGTGIKKIKLGAIQRRFSRLANDIGLLPYKNIIRKAINSNNNYDSYVSKLRSYFLPERVRNY